MMAPRDKKKPVLPILNYYLTFIHYFGFSINPSVRRAPVKGSRVQYESSGRENCSHQKIVLNQPDDGQQDDGEPSSGSSVQLVRRQFLLLKKIAKIALGCANTGIKLVAISFTTFIALNHCIVLVDYIYQGSKAFEELMLDVRLVITKFSALIFVLSWHFNQTKVRRLIKLVRSTSIYILGTYGRANARLQTVKSRPAASAADEEHENDEHTKEGSKNHERLGSCSGSPIMSGRVGENNPQDLWTIPTTCRRLSQRVRKLTQPMVGWHLEAEHEVEEELDEISESFYLDTGVIDRRILNWWLMCLVVTALHFSLSEAEITKSHHLWQWLDDYSMHQLNNQTTSLSTLMFLASFDNYIYTVHVYGTRLIGASIICIVCSLQRENINSLRWYVLHLLQTSGKLRARVANSEQRQQQQPRANLTSAHLTLGVRGREFSNYDPHYGHARYYTSHDQACRRFCNPNETDRVKLLMNSTDTDSSSAAGGSWSSCANERWNNNNNNNKPCNNNDNDNFQQNENNESTSTSEASDSEVSCLTDRDLFFILGESDWLRVCENEQRLMPCGHLSSSLWHAKSWLQAPLNQGAWVARLTIENICMRLYGCAGFMTSQKASSQVESERKHQREQHGQKEEKLNFTIVRSPKVTPTACDTCPTGGGATHGQVNSSVIKSGKKKNKASDQCCCQPTPTTNGATDADARLGRLTNTARTALNAATAINNNPGWPLGCNFMQTPQFHETHKATSLNDRVSDMIEWQLERLASRYELVRTVNCRIDACFGPMLLIQYSFLFLMSCIDVVYFSICFNPNTKTKYIIISGMILLWWPYLLLYKFASDIQSGSKELLTVVRRLARLSLVESSSAALVRGEPSSGKFANYFWNKKSRRQQDEKGEFEANISVGGYLNDTDSPNSLEYGSQSLWLLGHTSALEKARAVAAGCRAGKARARIINKLDHVFKPTSLSIIGVMTIDKFFLLNFAKIVITASVMIIQFISHKTDS